MATANNVSVFGTAPAGATGPDSLAVGNGVLFAAYTNGADSTGASGTSTIVEYSLSTGSIVQTYSIAGYVDGLKVDPYQNSAGTAGILWVLQNQDGNSALTLIDPTKPVNSGTVGTATYMPTNTMRGFDDVVFTPNAVYESYTNPGSAGDPVVVRIDQGNSPGGTISFGTTILAFGAMGTNTVSGTVGAVPLNDPDSLKSLPNGDLVLTSGDDGTFVEIHNVGASNQYVTFTPITNGGSATRGLDDVIQPSASVGTFYVADQGGNRIDAIRASGLNTGDFYASVGSTNSFAEINPANGTQTALVGTANAPGGVFGAPHGLAFVAAAPTATNVSVFASGPTATSAIDSITVGNGHLWAAYTNGADSTGASGTSTVVEYSLASGSVINTSSFAGYTDGLKIDPFNGNVWVLQNQDGNSSLTILNSSGTVVSANLPYQPTSGARGYDDVVFTNNGVFESYTNPVNPGDPTIVKLAGSDAPTGTVTWTPILRFGDMGTDSVTGTLGVIPQTDPDSLKLGPNGDLLFSGNADGTLIDVHNPGSSNQYVTFTTVNGVDTVAGASLDDTIRPSTTAGTFYVADQKNNRIVVVQATNLNTSDYYGSIGQFNDFAQIDPTTGQQVALLGTANAPGGSFGSPHGADFVPACYAAATRILTARGEVRVEDLQTGDRVVTVSGRLAPVVWIGHRTVDCQRHAKACEVMPVRVRADAFGPGLPIRDLVLSPDHAVFAEGVLIPVKQLLNGISVVQETVESVAYVHVELDRHDVLLAEGLPAESYLDAGNRAAFVNAGLPTMLHANFVPQWIDHAFAPFAVEGAVVEAIRAQLADRLTANGWMVTTRADLRLLVDGAIVTPAFVASGRHAFRLDAAARSVRLLSNSGVPAFVSTDAYDLRCLGVSITGATLATDAGTWSIGAADARLSAGFHPAESDAESAWRWTDGNAVLPRFWPAESGAATLTIDVARVQPSWLWGGEAVATAAAAG